MRLVDTQAATLAIPGVTRVKLRSWLHRGYITRHGHDLQGRALVDLNEVAAYVEQKNLTNALTCCNT